MITIDINGVILNFYTQTTLFSPNGLDSGTNAMLSCVHFKTTDKVLDLGCGYGVVGIYAAKLIGEQNVTMVDVDATAIDVTRKNAKLNGVPNARVIHSDGFKNIDDSDYTLVLSNPPYHSDFSTAKHFIEKGFNRLIMGGKMVMVIKRKDWYKNKLIAIFGGVSIEKIDDYFIFTAEKRSDKYAKTAKLSRGCRQ